MRPSQLNPDAGSSHAHLIVPLTGYRGLRLKRLAWKDNGTRLTRLSSILMRASNSCSPSRLFCMGPKVLPAHCTEPTSWGRCFSCSRRMRFSTPPALDRADTCGKEHRDLSLCVCVCVCVCVHMSRNVSCMWLFPPRGNLLGMHPFPGTEVLAISFLVLVLRDYRGGGNHANVKP